MRPAALIVLVLTLLFGNAASARAQSWPERIHVSINGAYQATSNDFSDRLEFERNLESGSSDVDYPVKGGFVFDAGGGFRFWKNLAAGVAVSYFTRDDVASTTSSVPHPFFFDQPRQVTGDATGVKRTETTVHVQAMYLVNPGGHLRLILSGGPSFFDVEQDLVSEVVVTETYPFDTAAFGSAKKTKATGSAAAFNVGADVIWMFGKTVGVGGLVRYSRATVDLDAPDNRTVTVDAGGLYAGGGLRLLF